jgi:hypothetical protein
MEAVSSTKTLVPSYKTTTDIFTAERTSNPDSLNGNELSRPCIFQCVSGEHKLTSVCYLVRTSLQSRPVSRSWELGRTMTGTLCSGCPGVDGVASPCDCSPSRTSRAATPLGGSRGGAHRVFSRWPQFRMSICTTRHKWISPSGLPFYLQPLTAGVAKQPKEKSVGERCLLFYVASIGELCIEIQNKKKINST